MKRESSKSFMARVRSNLAEMHPSERRLAEAVLDFPGDMAGYSASEIAEHAGVSNATVSRFVRKIGYGSYDEARKAVREEGQNGATLLRFGTSPDDPSGAVTAHGEQSRLNVEKTLSGLDTSVIDQIAATLHAAPHVWIAGFRAGYPLANYLAWQISQVIPKYSILPKTGETLPETAATFKAGDTLILLALRRCPVSAKYLAETALEAGLDVLMITDLPEYEAIRARWILACSTTSNGPLLNHTGVLSLCNLIAARTLELSPPETRRRLERIEELHERFGEL